MPAMTTRQSSWLKLADEISEKIHTGQLKPGDQLPTETALQDRTGKSRTTVRQAIAELRSRGRSEPSARRAVSSSAPVARFSYVPGSR